MSGFNLSALAVRERSVTLFAILLISIAGVLVESVRSERHNAISLLQTFAHADGVAIDAIHLDRAPRHSPRLLEDGPHARPVAAVEERADGDA